DTRAMDVRTEAKIPCVAMLFNLPKGPATLTFQIKSPKHAVLATQAEKIDIGENERVHFHSTQLVFTPKEEGRHVLEIVANGKTIGRAAIALEVQGLDESLHDHEANVAAEDGDPDADLVVAQSADDDPL